MPAIYTNILALPLAHLEIETGNNEWWIDTVAYITPDEHQIDLRHIDFEMMLRRRPDAHEVILYASTQNGWLSIGGPPNYGHLIIGVPEEVMRGYFAGQYVGDVRARDDRYYRRTITFNLTIIEGVTKTINLPALVRSAA